MALAGALEIQMFANIARLQKDMGDAKRVVGDAVATIEKALGAIGVSFSASMLLEKINSVTEGMAKLKDASEKTGASVEELSKLQFFAGTVGKDIGSVELALGQLAKAMSAAGNATSAQALAFAKLQISTKDSLGNEKDLNAVYREIATALDKYSDGAGKNAIARALMGKAGADQIPIMKKIGELGDIEASVTTAQTAAAEAYRIELARLNQQKEILWNTIVSALLPTMGTLVGVMLEASKKTDSLSSSTKQLAADGSIESWADSTAMGIARVVDVARTLIGIMSEIEAPFERYFKASQSGFAALSIKMGPGTDQEKDLALTMLREQAARENAALRARMAGGSFLTTPLNTSTSDAVAAAIRARNASNPPGTGPWSGPVDQYGQSITKPSLNFETPDKAAIAAAAAELKLYENALQRLEIQLGKTNGQSAEEKIMYELLYGSLQKVSFAIDKEGLSHAGNLLAMARAIDKREQFLAVLKLSGEYYDALYKSQDALNKLQTAGVESDQAYLEDLGFQIDLIGKTTIVQQQMNEVRKIDLKLRQDLRSAADTAGDNMTQYDAARDALITQAAAQKTAVLSSVAVRVQAERDWATGANAAFNEYIDNATNAAQQAKTAFTNLYKGMEDGLFNFFRHGTNGFKDFVSTVKDMLARLAAQQITVQIVGAVGLGWASGAANAAGSSGGASSFLGSAAGQVAGAAAGTGVGASLTSLIGANAVGAAGGDALGTMIGMNAASWGVATEAGTAASVGAMATAAIPYVGLALAAAYALGVFGGSDERHADLIATGVAGKISRGGLQGNLVSTWGSGTSDAWGGTTSSALPSAALASINNSISNIFTNMSDAATKMGLSVAGLDSVMVGFGASWTNGDQTQADLTKAFNATSDAIAEKLIPNIRDLQFQGETLTQTFARLAAVQAALDAQKRTMEIQLMEAQGKAVEALAAKREDEIKALDATLRPLQAMINAAEDLATAFTAAQTAARDAVDASINDSQKLADTYRAAADAYKQAVKTISDTMNQLSGGALSPLTSGEQYANAQTAFNALADKLVSNVQADQTDALAKLPQAANDFLTASRAQNSSSAKFTDDFNVVMKTLASGEKVGGMLGADQDSLANYFDKNTQTLQDGLKTIADAVASDASVTLLTDISAKLSSDATDSAGGLLKQLVYQSYMVRFDQQVGDMWKSANGSMSAFDAAYAIWIAANPIPSHASGLNRVPYDGYTATLHANEAVLTVPQASDWRSGSQGITSEDLRALRADVQRLTAIVAAGDNANVQATERVAQSQENAAWRAEVRPVVK